MIAGVIAKITPAIIDQQVARDRKQPRELASSGRIEAAPRAQRVLEGGLREVLGQIPIANAVGEEAVDLPDMLLVHACKVRFGRLHRKMTRSRLGRASPARTTKTVRAQITSPRYVLVRFGYAPEGLSQLLESAGLTVTELTFVSGKTPQRLTNWLRFLRRILPSRAAWLMTLPLRPLAVLDPFGTHDYPYLSVAARAGHPDWSVKSPTPLELARR